ncbi:MAG: MnhB domain-containing protein [Pseudomonadota bacterium]
MNSLILHTFARLLVALMLLFSLFLLLRGHNEPGGGFLGGLVAAAGLILFAICDGAAAVRKAIGVAPLTVALAGLLVAVLAGLLASPLGLPFLSGVWAFLGAYGDAKGLPLGSPLLFDVGVYLVVVGSISAVVLALEEEIRG